MDLTLPANMVIRQGDFKGIFDGYFLVTDTYAIKPVVSSRLLTELQTLVHKISVFDEDNFNKSASQWLKSYGVDPYKFLIYLSQNKQKIVDSVGGYFAIADLIAQYERLAKIKQGHSVGEFIDYLGSKVKGGISSVATGIGDILSKGLLHLLPVILIVVALFLVFVYGMGKLNKSK